MTAALEGGEWSAARPGRTLSPGKTRYTFYRRLSGPQGRSGRTEKFRPHRNSIPDRSARSKSLYRLNYPAHYKGRIIFTETIRSRNKGKRVAEVHGSSKNRWNRGIKISSKYLKMWTVHVHLRRNERRRSENYIHGKTPEMLDNV